MAGDDTSSEGKIAGSSEGNCDFRSEFLCAGPARAARRRLLKTSGKELSMQDASPDAGTPCDRRRALHIT
jgi:hypothetical protein